MPKCSECLYGRYELEGEWYIPVFWCKIAREYIDESDAENEELGCDLFVKHNISDNTTKKP